MLEGGQSASLRRLLASRYRDKGLQPLPEDKYDMKCSIPTHLASDLHDLLLDAEQAAHSLTVAHESCIFSRGRGSAIFSVIDTHYALAIIASGWCVGEHSQPWQFHLIGDAAEAFRWLRGHTSKRLMRYLAHALPLSPEDRTLCLLLA